MRDDESVVTVRRLIREADKATLSTSHAQRTSWPYGSLVLPACDFDASPLLLLSDLSDHVKNLAHEPRASLLFDGTAGLENPLAGPRVTVLGRLHRTREAYLLSRYLTHHPSAGVYAGFADFHLYRMRIDAAHLVAGFGKIAWLTGARLRLPACDRRAWAAAHERLVRRLNDGAAELVAAALRRAGARRPEVVAVDPEGLDLVDGRRRVRLSFDRPIAGPRGVIAALKRLS